VSNFFQRVLLALVVGLLGAAFLSVPAQAHTDLIEAVPADGSELEVAPTKVTFTFNEELLEATVRVSITNESGAVVAKDVAESAGSVVTVPWPADLPVGTYSVSYRVVSGDGHPVTGEIVFTYGSNDATSEPTPAIADSAPSATGTEVVELDPTEAVVIAQPADASESRDSSIPAILIGVVIAGALITALFVWNRRRA
jgi:methionine-rich copper-binding protein CopC